MKTKSNSVSGATLKKEMTANKVFGTPMISKALKGHYPTMQTKKKMTPTALAKRKRSTISNAAGKTMGGLYSK